MPGPLLPLNGLTVCYMALPTIAGSFFKHCLASKDSDPSNRTDIKLDEALAITRTMVQKFSQYPIEDVQRLSNAFQPAPWNVRVIRVSIPASTCSSAAEYLIDGFGPEELKNVIGGRQWWQLRSNKDGSVEGEWIAMKRDLPRSPSTPQTSPATSKSSPVSADNHSPRSSSHHPSHSKQKSLLDSLRGRRTESPSRRTSVASTPVPNDQQSGFGPFLIQEPFLPSDPNTSEPQNNDPLSTPSDTAVPSDAYEEDLDQMPCMLYIHGGAYYFGSVNTHRYTIWRYARKMGGRAFAVNYRHAPQYPFPCALADCLAAYLYLIRPPQDAKHRAIDSSKIVIAGDSAGGGLSLALLTLIRDAGLPMPAGAVLISPWVDLTHSFPSVMSNADKDIIPPYGFMHQPSVLWPPPSSTASASPGKSSQSEISTPPPPVESNVQSQSDPDPNPGVDLNPFKLKVSPELKTRIDESDGITPIIEFADGEMVKMNQQIQFYATNDQLTHPYCSPLFSPSLGGLPPLFIIAGQNEVLRDEIIYMAHRAAHPDRYPLRKDLLDANPLRKTKADGYPPTQVHLQVYDDMFHVLPLFSFLRPAKYCYRAIGSFCKFVTDSTKEAHADSPIDLSDGSSTGHQVVNLESAQPLVDEPVHHLVRPPASPRVEASPRVGAPTQSHRMSLAKLPRIKLGKSAPLSRDTLQELEHTIYHASLPHQRPEFVDGMIRERVATDGKIRPLEDETELEVLRISSDQLGVIKPGPLRRWAEGRKIWNHKFERSYKKIQLEREHQIKRSHKRVKESLKKISKCRNSKQHTVNSADPPQLESESSQGNLETSGGSEDIAQIQSGCFLPEEERPPPCSVAARHDNAESLKLAKVLERRRLSKVLTSAPQVTA